MFEAATSWPTGSGVAAAKLSLGGGAADDDAGATNVSAARIVAARRPCLTAPRLA
jgi:hypothetical protein